MPGLTIGAVATLAGVRVDTIRYYERIGLLPKPPRTPAGYRVYGPAVVNRLTLIRSAQRFGFPLRAIAGFLQVREAGGAPCRDVRAAAQRLLDAVDGEIAALTATRRRMRDTLRSWDAALARTHRAARRGCSSGSRRTIDRADEDRAVADEGRFHQTQFPALCPRHSSHLIG